ncbi:MutS-related protein [Paenibacillus ginsengarvi]|nr:hypothetical protein [Paenibacillus ginsengarvi]
MSMNTSSWSLLYPEEYSAYSGEETAVADLSVITALQAEALFGEMRRAFKFKPAQKHPSVYLTDRVEVIRYRLEAVEDILNHEPLFKLLEKLLPDLEDMKELHQTNTKTDVDMYDYLTAISEIEVYVGLLEKLYDFFCREPKDFQSRAFKAFAAEIRQLYEDPAHGSLKAEYAKMSQSIRSIKSMTIGVNLDARFRPAEAGVVAVHTESFRSGQLIDRLLRIDFANDGFTCLAPLEPVGKGLTPEQLVAMKSAVNGALHTMLKSSMKNWRPVVRAFTIAKSRFVMRFVDEIRFLVGGVALLKRLLSAGMPLCKPEVCPMESKTFTVKGLYNPVVALNMQPSGGDSEKGKVVLNEMKFDDDGMIYILTGPNQGGKTVFVQAVGMAQLLFQLGLFVPAFSASISPVDRIYSHFPDRQERYANGRFADECERLMRICEKLTGHSLLLMDETFSSTSASEATFIAEQVLLGLRESGCRVLFATHLHDLARSIDELNGRLESSVCRIDSLTAEMETENGTAARSYKIVRSRPQGSSYARDIAEKYGLTYEHLMASLGRRNAGQERERLP